MKQNGTKLTPPDAIMASALSLGRALGIDDRSLARSAVTLAVALAQKDGDPDGFLRTLLPMTQKD